MRALTILDEDFTNYKVPAMFIGTIQCGGKCCIEAGMPLCTCHNDQWRGRNPLNLSEDELINRYFSNSLTSAIVFGGLEPFEQYDELKTFVDTFRAKSNDDIVIYTGYNKDEIESEIKELSEYPNIVVKFGRFVPNCEKVYDEILGVTLASDNQYAERIS